MVILIIIIIIIIIIFHCRWYSFPKGEEIKQIIIHKLNFIGVLRKACGVIIIILFILIAFGTLNPEGEGIKHLRKKIKIYWCVSFCFGRPRCWAESYWVRPNK